MSHKDPKINTKIAAGGVIHIGCQMFISWGQTSTGHTTEKVIRHKISAASGNDFGRELN